MIANLLHIRVQPSEIEAMTFKRLSFYNDFAEVMIKARMDAADGIE